MVDFGGAIKRPFTDFKKLGIGILIYFVAVIPFIGWLISFFITGYGIECAKTAMKKDYKLPEWTDWGNLWVNGILYLFIGLIYMIPLALIGAFTIGSALIKNWVLFTAENPDPVALAAAFGGNSVTLLWILLLLFLIMIITVYVLPMAIMRFVATGKFGDAFNLREVFRKAFTSKYFVTVILLWVYVFAILIVTSLLYVITAITFILPLIITAVIGFVITITSMTVFGEVYSEIK